MSFLFLSLSFVMDLQHTLPFIVFNPLVGCNARVTFIHRCARLRQKGAACHHAVGLTEESPLPPSGSVTAKPRVSTATRAWESVACLTVSFPVKAEHCFPHLMG